MSDVLEKEIEALKERIDNLEKPKRSNYWFGMLFVCIAILIALAVAVVLCHNKISSLSNCINTATSVETVTCGATNNSTEKNAKENYPLIIKKESYVSTKVFYLVLDLGILTILAVSFLVMLNILSKGCMQEEKLNVLNTYCQKIPNQGLKFKETIEKDSKKDSATNENKYNESNKEKQNEEELGIKNEPYTSYVSFEKIVKHITDCIVEI